MRYLVSVILDGHTSNDVFTDFKMALAHFKQHCESGHCTAIYNLV